jgi:hypothetical protein
MRWSRRLNRPLTGTEMLAAMGLAVTPELAKGAGVQMADVSMLKNNAKAGGYGAFLFHLKF